MARATKYESAFAKALSEQLSAKPMTQSQLATVTSAHPAYISKVMNGERTVSPHWADVIARALDVDRKTRAKLHRAAAKDAGYKID